MSNPPIPTAGNVSPQPAGELSDPEPRSSIFTWLRKLLSPRRETSLREALEETIEEHEELTEERLDPEEKEMLQNILSFGDIQVSDIMIPRMDIEAVPVDVSLEELKNHIVKYRHTRVPVYEETRDHIRGFIHAKDLLPMLSGDEEYSLRAIMRPLLFIAPSMRISDLLFKMRSAGIHIAIIVDEYGGTDGLVTMEDLFEEIVGEIHDEHDEDEEPLDKVKKISDNSYEVNARITMERLEEELGINFVAKEDDDEFETLGGFIFFLLGRVPAKGEIVTHDSGVRFEIIDADPRRVHKVRIHKAS